MVDPWWRNLAFTEVACSGVYRAVGRRQRRLRVDFAFSAPLQPSWSSVHWLWPSCSSVHLLLQCKFAAAGLGLAQLVVSCTADLGREYADKEP